MIRRAVVAAVLLAVLAAPTTAEETADRAPALQTQIYPIRFRDPKDVLLLLQPFLGEYGAITLQPRLRAVTVIDEAGRLRRIEEVIKAFDVPPRQVNLALQLIIGTRAGDDEGFIRNRPRQSLPGIDTTLIETLEQTRYEEYQLLASASFTAAEGEESTLQLGADYRIRLKLASVNLDEGITRFDRFALERSRGEEGPGGPGGSDGQGAAARGFQPIWDMELNLRDNQLHVFGATRLEDSKRALFLAVTAGIVP